MKGIDALAQMVSIQSTPGNYDYNPYMHGMANALILALATMLGTEPVFLDAPAQWRQDGPAMHRVPAVGPAAEALTVVAGLGRDLPVSPLSPLD